MENAHYVLFIPMENEDNIYDEMEPYMGVVRRLDYDSLRDAVEMATNLHDQGVHVILWFTGSEDE